MIFVTVGTQKFQFDRLFKEIDRLISTGHLKEEIIAQRGYSEYFSGNFSSQKLIDEEQMVKNIEDSSLVIAHAGTSSIIQCIRMGKKVIVVPRMKQYGEHVDDHQLEIAKLFETKQLIEAVYNIRDLGDKIDLTRKKEYATYDFNNKKLLSSIENYLHSL